MQGDTISDGVHELHISIIFKEFDFIVSMQMNVTNAYMALLLIKTIIYVEIKWFEIGTFQNIYWHTEFNTVNGMGNP